MKYRFLLSLALALLGTACVDDFDDIEYPSAMVNHTRSGLDLRITLDGVPHRGVSSEVLGFNQSDRYHYVVRERVCPRDATGPCTYPVSRRVTVTGTSSDGSISGSCEVWMNSSDAGARQGNSSMANVEFYLLTYWSIHTGQNVTELRCRDLSGMH